LYGPRHSHVPGLDGRSLQSPAYRASQIVRKRIEQFFGRDKTVGGRRKIRLRGVRRNLTLMHVTAADYNLVRLSRLAPATG
jgi:hypothetical protein